MIEATLLFAIMLGGILLGVPVFAAMAVSVGVFAAAFPGAMQPFIIAQSFVQGLDSTALVAIPLFFLAGAIMNRGGISARLLALARSLIGHQRGGLAQVNVTGSVIFAGVSGSAVADAAAMGSVLIPAMKREGYPPAFAAAITGASAAIGLIVPPSIPLVVFALLASQGVGDLFLAGILPGLAMAVGLAIAAAILSRRRDFPRSDRQSWAACGRAALRAGPALLMPILIVGGLVGGFATTAEIGAIAVGYALFVAGIVHRELRLADLARCLVEAGGDAAKVLLIVGVSGAYVWIIASLGLAADIADLVAGWGLPGPLLLAAIAALLLILGTVLEPMTLLIVLVPLLLPAVLTAGIDPVQFGIVVTLALAIGLVTPPVGILIYLTAAQAGIGPLAVVRELSPFVLALILVLLLVIAAPPLTLGLSVLVS